MVHGLSHSPEQEACADAGTDGHGTPDGHAVSRLRILAADNYVAVTNGHEHHTEDDKCQGQQVDVPTQIVCHTVEQRGHKVAYGLAPDNAGGDEQSQDNDSRPERRLIHPFIFQLCTHQFSPLVSFLNREFKQRHVCDVIKSNYGHAGRLFVEYLKTVDISTLKGIQDEFLDKLQLIASMAKQALSLSVILTADKLATDLFFKDGQYIDIQEATEMLAEREEVSENERCYQYILNKIAMNPSRFSDDEEHAEHWGQLLNGYARFYLEAFRKLCKEGGYIDKSFLQ